MQVNTLAIDLGELRALTNARRELRGAAACRTKDLKLSKREQLFAEYRRGTSFTGVIDVTTGEEISTRQWRRVYARAVPSTVGNANVQWVLWRYWTGCRLEDTPHVKLVAKPIAQGWQLEIRWRGGKWKEHRQIMAIVPPTEVDEMMVLLYPRLLPMVLSMEARYGSTDMRRGAPKRAWDLDLDWVMAQSEGRYTTPERTPVWFPVDE